MKGTRGFTIVELLVVISIIAVIAGMATLSWNRMVMKSAVESQIKMVHADMMSVRLDALYSKRARRVTLVGKVFNIYSSTATATSVTPVSTRTFKYNFLSKPTNLVANDFVEFDTGGLMNGSQGTFCIDALNDTLKTTDASVDSIVVSQGRINLAKRPEGGKCDTSTGGVTQK
jgi:prepilin-type N-terminal cleavage/methylation domain-containing protein